eukprot:1172217-Rhodomonas_salina.1
MELPEGHGMNAMSGEARVGKTVWGGRFCVDVGKFKVQSGGHVVGKEAGDLLEGVELQVHRRRSNLACFQIDQSWRVSSAKKPRRADVQSDVVSSLRCDVGPRRRRRMESAMRERERRRDRQLEEEVCGWRRLRVRLPSNSGCYCPREA